MTHSHQTHPKLLTFEDLACVKEGLASVAYHQVKPILGSYLKEQFENFLQSVRSGDYVHVAG